MDPQSFGGQSSQRPEADNPLAVMQPGEEVICEIRRSPVGLFAPYMGAAIVIVAALLVALLVPYEITSITSQAKLGVMLAAGLVGMATLLYVYIATTVYTGNRWIVTSDSVTQISQAGLFSTQASQLSLENLEDVTVNQNGLFQSMFSFGTLRAETAGERSKFVFPYCPNPDGCARKIIAAREQFMAKRSS